MADDLKQTDSRPMMKKHIEVAENMASELLTFSVFEQYDMLRFIGERVAKKSEEHLAETACEMKGTEILLQLSNAMLSL